MNKKIIFDSILRRFINTRNSNLLRERFIMTENNFELTKLIEYPKSGIFSKVLVKTKNRDVTLFCMSKNSELSEHTSTKEGFVIVLDGEGTFTLKGKKIKMKKNVLIHMNKKEVHSLKAQKNTSFLLILIE